MQDGKCCWPCCSKKAETEIDWRLVLKEYQAIVAHFGNHFCPGHLMMVFAERPL